ncbi:MAG: long-chain fatty acid--CoA ligase, partial [Cyanobacteria bacterium QS_8_64_29]
MTDVSTPIDYTDCQSLSEIWPRAAERFGSTLALRDPRTEPETALSYQALYRQIRQFAAGLQAYGMQPQSKITLFAENSPRWLIADQGILMAGAANVVRSAQAPREELRYILRDSDSASAIVEDAQTLRDLHPELEALAPVVLLSSQLPEGELAQSVLSFDAVLAAGAERELEPVSITPDSLATLLYTSGTTGEPKGVMLSHRNLLHQVNAIADVIVPQRGDRALSILPSWHAYERSAEYYLLSQGCTQIYTSLRTFKRDLKQRQPHYMVGVPRLWEYVYEGIQDQLREQPAPRRRLARWLLAVSWRYVLAHRLARGLQLEALHTSRAKRLGASTLAALLAPLHALADRLVYRTIRAGVGGCLKATISGGGALPRYIDDFYELVGIPILVGYGLTETAPVTNARRPRHNLRGASGPPLPQTQMQIRDPETHQPLPPERKGLVVVRGPQVMAGYYKRPQETARAIDADGWFDTGDLGWITPSNDLVITGRAKDTIVLSNGENIEPQPIEMACLRSPYIDQIMLVGQDRRSLGALIVPNWEALRAWAAEQNQPLHLPEGGDPDSKPVRDRIRQELNQAVRERASYNPNERIGPFRLLSEPFSIENGLMTQTLKLRRSAVSERYSDT